MIDLKKLPKNKILGVNETMAALRRGTLSEVLIAKNYPAEELKRLASISGAKVTLLKQTNEEIGITLKKPFSISVIGIKK